MMKMSEKKNKISTDFESLSCMNTVSNLHVHLHVHNVGCHIITEIMITL